MRNRLVFWPVLVLLTLALFVLNIVYGAVHIPIGDVLRVLVSGGHDDGSLSFIILQSRFPRAVVALLCGSALSVCGFMLQTIFHNPLADTSLLGISSGAGIGVAFVMLLFGGSISIGALSVGGTLAVLLAAFAGAAAVAFLMFSLASLVRSNVVLLIFGIIISYLASSVILLLDFFASKDGLQSFVIWGMGSFDNVSSGQLPCFSIIILVGLALCMMLVKPLNATLLGTNYAENLGIDTRRLRNKVLVVAGLLSAVTTAYCGPVTFLGLAVPHITRMALRCDDFRTLLPASALVGGALSLLCCLCCYLPSEGGCFPINFITPVIGAPVVFAVILKRKI